MKIIRISAIWCSGCLVMKKIWKEIEILYPNIEYVDYDYDLDIEEFKDYNVGDIVPINIFIKDDKEILRLVGEKSREDIICAIKKVVENEEV